jgi:hypothetical protein
VTVAAVTGGPALGNVRFNVTLGGSGTPASARVRLYVAARDRSSLVGKDSPHVAPTAAAAPAPTAKPASEFDRLAAAPVLRGLARRPRPSAQSAGDAYQTLADALSPNHPALDAVRTSLERRYGSPHSTSSRHGSSTGPGRSGDQKPRKHSKSVSDLGSAIRTALQAMAFPPIGGAWSIWQITPDSDGIQTPGEVVSGGLGVHVIPAESALQPNAPYMSVATKAEMFHPRTQMNVWSMSKTVTAVAVMKAIDRYLHPFTRAFPVVPLPGSDPLIPDAYGAAVAEILRWPLIDKGHPERDLIAYGLLRGHHAWEVAETITIHDLLAHLAFPVHDRGFDPGGADWSPTDFYKNIQGDIQGVTTSDIGTKKGYSNTGYYLLRGVIAYLSWLVDNHGFPGHGAAGDDPNTIAALDEVIGDQYRSFVRSYVLEPCFGASSPEPELHTPHVDVRSTQTCCFPARPWLTENLLFWFPWPSAQVGQSNPPAWVLGGDSDWVFSVRSYGQFLSSVIAGRVINLGLWKAMQDPSCLPSVFESPPLGFPRLSTLSSHPYGMVSAKADSPHTLPTDEIWYKPGDGEWSRDRDSPCDRVTNQALLSGHADMTLDANGQPACQAVRSERTPSGFSPGVQLQSSS